MPTTCDHCQHYVPFLNPGGIKENRGLCMHAHVQWAFDREKQVPTGAKDTCDNFKEAKP